MMMIMMMMMMMTRMTIMEPALKFIVFYFKRIRGGVKGL